MIQYTLMHDDKSTVNQKLYLMSDSFENVADLEVRM